MMVEDVMYWSVFVWLVIISRLRIKEAYSCEVLFLERSRLRIYTNILFALVFRLYFPLIIA